LIVNQNVPIAALSKQSPVEPNETRNPASEAVLRPPAEPELRAAVRVMDQPVRIGRAAAERHDEGVDDESGVLACGARRRADHPLTGALIETAD
jgi:hypothetical protein